MKKFTSRLGAAILISMLFINCGGAIDNGNWSGNDYSIKAEYELTTTPDGRYDLRGTTYGMPGGGLGNYKKIRESELLFTTGGWAGTRVVKDGSNVKLYLDNGSYFMTLY